MVTTRPTAATLEAAPALRPLTRGQRRDFGRFGSGLTLTARLLGTAAALAAGLLASCETTDPCALRQAACLAVDMIGNQKDDAGNPVAYRDLKVQVCTPTPETGDINAKCDPTAKCATELAHSDTLTLAATAAYSANVQGEVNFQLADSFNALPDSPPSMTVDAIEDVKAKIAKLKELRRSDPRAVRILITQAGQTTPVWDSRCDEDLFSDSEWTMLKYYRVGKNEYRAVYARLDKAKTSPP